MVAALGFGISAVSALSAGTPPTNGLSGLVLTPSSGDSGTTFAMGFSPDNQACPGDNNAGYFWSTFITPAAQDPALLTFAASGQPAGLDRTTAFRDSNDEFIRAKFPDLVSAAVLAPKFVSFDTTFSRNPVLAPGSYYVGIACSRSTDLTALKFWATKITVSSAPGAGPHGFAWAVDIGGATTTTTSTSTPSSTTTTTTIAGTTTTTIAPGLGVTVTPSSPAPGGTYAIALTDCSRGESVTFSQPESEPTSVIAQCTGSSTLASGSAAGLQVPTQASLGTATARFDAAPTSPGVYTVTMSGAVTGERVETFSVVGEATPPFAGNGTASTGGSPAGSTSTGTLPTAGSSTTALVVWAVLLLVFGRMAVLLGRRPHVIIGV